MFWPTTGLERGNSDSPGLPPGGSLISGHPDMTFVVDRALGTNYLYIYSQFLHPWYPTTGQNFWRERWAESESEHCKWVKTWVILKGRRGWLVFMKRLAAGKWKRVNTTDGKYKKKWKAEGLTRKENWLLHRRKKQTSLNMCGCACVLYVYVACVYVRMRLCMCPCESLCFYRYGMNKYICMLLMSLYNYYFQNYFEFWRDCSYNM